MGLRIRKRIKIAPGVRLNIGTKSSSVSVGGHGVTYTTKLYDGTKKKPKSGASASSGWFWKVLFWVFIGWWWWPLRLVCYDLPKLIIRKVRESKNS